jgi:hypothetical protein
MHLLLFLFAFSIGGLFIGNGLAPRWLRLPILIAASVLGCIALVVTLAKRSFPTFFGGAYVLLVSVGVVIRGERTEPGTAMVVVAGLTVAAAIGLVVALVLSGRQRRELERFIFSEATSVSFFVTMAAAITYGLLESWIDAPAVSMWWVWALGMTTWALMSALLKRRMT